MTAERTGGANKAVAPRTADPGAARSARRRSLLLVAGVYIVAFGTAIAAGALMGEAHPIWRVAVADLSATLVVFAASAACNNSSLYDPFWSVAPMVISGYYLVAIAGPEAVEARGAIVLLLVIVWGARLTGNWIRGWFGLSHEDWRYVGIRERTGRMYWPASFFGIHLLPTIVVFLGCLSLYPVYRRGGSAVGIGDALALFVTAGAIWIEARADRQLREFRAESRGASSPQNARIDRSELEGDMRTAATRRGAGRREAADSGAVLSSGLWKYSRHPNYFGEISFWWGLWLFGLAADPSYWWTIVGPLAITALFAFISVPMIDRRLRSRKPGYQEYMRRTSAVIPWMMGKGTPTGEKDA